MRGNCIDVSEHNGDIDWSLSNHEIDLQLYKTK